MKNSKKPMKVLFVSHSSELVGAETSLLLLLKYIDRDIFEPIVVLPGSGPLKKKIEGLNIWTFKIKSPWWVRGKVDIMRFGYCLVNEIIASFRFYRLIQREQVDIIYTNTIVNFSGAIAAFIARKPHIWHVREIIPENPDLHFFFPYKMLFWSISKLSNAIIANSNATADQFRSRRPIERINVIYNAVDFDRFEDSISFPNINGVNSEDWLVAVVGRLCRRKAQDDAIRAIEIAKEKISSIRLLLIGDGDRELKDYLKQMVVELSLSDKVIFTGYRDDVPKILRYCKVLLMPSWEEPFGRATIEAMAAGIPVIGTNRGGTKEIVRDGVTGYLVPSRNPIAIAKKLIELHQQPDLAKELGDNGKRIAKEKFTPQVYTQSVEEVIMKAVGKL